MDLELHLVHYMANVSMLRKLLCVSVYAIYPNTRFVKLFCYQVINLINKEPYH